jgi:hypothetical protein
VLVAGDLKHSPRRDSGSVGRLPGKNERLKGDCSYVSLAVVDRLVLKIGSTAGQAVELLGPGLSKGTAGHVCSPRLVWMLM